MVSRLLNGHTVSECSCLSLESSLSLHHFHYKVASVSLCLCYVFSLVLIFLVLSTLIFPPPLILWNYIAVSLFSLSPFASKLTMLPVQLSITFLQCVAMVMIPWTRANRLNKEWRKAMLNDVTMSWNWVKKGQKDKKKPRVRIIMGQTQFEIICN